MSAKRKTKPAAVPSKTLALRTCDAKMQGHGGFQWPESGPVVAPDWDPNPEIEYGHGLHGLAWGDGDWSLLSSDSSAKWLVVEVDAADLVVAQGGTKHRYRAGTVVYCGDEVGAVSRVMCGVENFDRIAALAKGKSKATGDYSKAASSGNYSKAASSGDSGIAASIGNGGSAKAGPSGLVIVCWWDDPAKRYRACVGEVGIDGILADTWYRAVNGKLEIAP